MTGSEGHEGVNVDVYIIHPFDRGDTISGPNANLRSLSEMYVAAQGCWCVRAMPKLCTCKDEEGKISEKRIIAHCTNMNPMREVNAQTKPVRCGVGIVATVAAKAATLFSPY